MFSIKKKKTTLSIFPRSHFYICPYILVLVFWFWFWFWFSLRWLPCERIPQIIELISVFFIHQNDDIFEKKKKLCNPFIKNSYICFKRFFFFFLKKEDWRLKLLHMTIIIVVQFRINHYCKKKITGIHNFKGLLDYGSSIAVIFYKSLEVIFFVEIVKISVLKIMFQISQQLIGNKSMIAGIKRYAHI